MSIKKNLRLLVRHIIIRLKLEKVRMRINRVRGVAKTGHLAHSTLAQVFAAIYKSDAWIADRQQDSLSGPGSSISSTRPLLQKLGGILESLSCKTLVDLGCGDFVWMKYLDGPWSYVGVDIVDEVISVNALQYQNSRRTFVRLDATVDRIPPGDVVLCREVLFHLSFEDIWKVISNVASCGCEYLIATTEEDIWLNSDIVSGDYRPINLHKKPFSFPNASNYIVDSAVESTRALGVWHVSQVPHRKCK